MFIDTHAHLYYDDLKSQLDDIVTRAQDAGVNQILCVGTDIALSKASIIIADQYPDIYATVGIHPHDAKDAETNYLSVIEDLISHPKVVALGEMGLDFSRNLSPKEIQIKMFTAQLQLAKKLNLPAIIHNRDADEDILKILREINYQKTVIHCFSSDAKMAADVLKLGGLISFTGIVTFGKNHTESVLKSISLEDFILETDCPFLAPVPNRGKLNEPANIPHIAKRIAEIKNVELEEIAKVTTHNTKQFFNLPS